MKRLLLAAAAMSLLLSPGRSGAADFCATAGATVTLTDLTWTEEDGLVRAKGAWTAGEGAAGVEVEYRVQSDRQWAEWRSGASGSWEVAFPYSVCRRNTFQVDVSPSFKSGSVLVHCLNQGRAVATRDFVISCQAQAQIGPCQWECEEGPPARCSGLCTGTARKGVGGLVALVGVNDQDYQVAEGPVKGPWSVPVTCAPGDRVTFKVRDRDGTGGFSNIAEQPCGKE